VYTEVSIRKISHYFQKERREKQGGAVHFVWEGVVLVAAVAANTRQTRTGILLQFSRHRTLLQGLRQDSATLTGWRRTKRSGEGKMIALNGPGISLLRYLNFPAFFRIPEFSGDLHDHLSGELLSYAGI
jgi:hypothetical protein